MRCAAMLRCRGRILAICCAATVVIAGCELGNLFESGGAIRTPRAAVESYPPAEDAGLALYRDESSRDAVVDFYCELTGRTDVAQAILTGAEKHGIPFPLAFALAWAESGYDARAKNANASSIDRGLYQLNSATFPWLEEAELFDPEVSADYGLAHLEFCMQEGRNELVGLAMYNAGTMGVRAGTPLSTLNHVARILSYRDAVQAAFRDYVNAGDATAARRLAASG